MKAIPSTLLLATFVSSGLAFAPAPARTWLSRTSYLRANLRAEADDEYDLVVIGGGSGGVRASRIASGYGKKVALLEPQLEHGPPDYSAIGGTVSTIYE